MTPLIDYWLKTNLFLLLFFGLYSLLLRRHTFLTLNRTYLLGSLVLAGLLPLVHIPGLALEWPQETAVPAYSAVSIDAVAMGGTYSATPAAPLLPDWPVLAQWAFWLMVAGLLLRTGWRTISLLRLIRQWPAQPVRGTALPDHTLVLPDTARIPTFSFFRYLVLNPNDAQAEAVRQHELVHIRQWHSADVLLLEVIQALCWPNPALIGYRRAIRQVHEYLADRDAPAPDQRDAYARFLVSYAFHIPTDALTHSFGAARPDSPTLKQRIQMLYTQHTHRRALWKYALVLPLAAALLAMTTKPEVPVNATTNVPVPVNTVRVEGLVNDQAGNPLPGASVMIKNTQISVMTDSRGHFDLNVPGGTVLVASFVGFQSSEMAVAKNARDVVMVFKLRQLGASGLPMPVVDAPDPKSGHSVIEGDIARAKEENEVFTVVEQNPMYPGGMNKLFEFVAKTIRYPAEARQRKVQGKVFVSFVVNTDGSIDRIKVLKGLGFGCDEEAVRVMESMPNWIPGRQNGRAVAVRYNLPITFGLNRKVGSTGKPAPDTRVGRSSVDSVVNNSPHIDGPPNAKIVLKQPNESANSPLFILNGAVITQEKMNGLDPNTIQTISILKDDSATAIHGERGRNGVVIITTKKYVEAETAKEKKSGRD